MNYTLHIDRLIVQFTDIISFEIKLSCSQLNGHNTTNSGR